MKIQVHYQSKVYFLEYDENESIEILKSILEIEVKNLNEDRIEYSFLNTKLQKLNSRKQQQFEILQLPVLGYNLTY
jgi:hypothetical protein